MAFPGLHHVAVTVTDIDRGREWYTRLFGSEPVIDEDAGAFYHVVWGVEGGGLFGIHSHPKDNPNPQFTEFGTGLDHISFLVPDRPSLEEWESKLNELGISHGGIVDAPYGSGLSFRDPDNLPLELFAPPG